MNETIIKFLQEQTCASICCVDESGRPYCFSCFYAFNSVTAMLYFKSSAQSRHAGLLQKSPFVAGTVLPDKLHKMTIQGIQFEGTVLDTRQPLVKRTLGIYLAKHPLALAIPGDIWALQLNSVKMTDSTLGFGKKLLWEREGEKQHAVNGIMNNLNLN